MSENKPNTKLIIIHPTGGDPKKANYKVAQFSGNYVTYSYFETLICDLTSSRFHAPSIFFDNLKEAFKYMKEYLDGTLPDGSMVDEAVKYAAKNGTQKTVKKFQKGAYVGKDSKFDNDLLAWTNYWYEQHKSQSWTFIDAEIPKAITAHEANWGTYSPHNGLRDVMQTLYPGDPNLWLAAHIDPLVPGKTHYGETEYVVSTWDCKSYGIASRTSAYDANEALSAGFGKDGLGLLKPVIQQTGGGTIGNEYLIRYDRVTSRMSIAVGIGMLYHKNRSKTNIKQLIKDYNGGGVANYYELVKVHMDAMGYTKQNLAR